eukprot:5215885-Amphidinium_carterae.1
MNSFCLVEQLGAQRLRVGAHVGSLCRQLQHVRAIHSPIQPCLRQLLGGGPICQCGSVMSHVAALLVVAWHRASSLNVSSVSKLCQGLLNWTNSEHSVQSRGRWGDSPEDGLGATFA